MSNQLAGSKADKSAMLNFLEYSHTLNHVDVSDKAQVRLYDHFYDKQGNLYSADKIGDKAHEYLKDNGTASLQQSLKDATIVDAINKDNYVGVAVKFKDDSKVYVSGRGSDNIQDWLVTNASIAVAQYAPDLPVIDMPLAEKNAANEFALRIYEKYKDLVLTGHSQSGYFSQEQGAYLISKNLNSANTIQVETFNSPQAGKYIKDYFGQEVFDKVGSVTINNNISADKVHLIGERVGKEVTYYSTADNALSAHSSSMFVFPNQSTFDPGNNKYLNSNGNLSEIVLADRLTLLDNVIESQEGLLANNSSVENIWLKTLNDTDFADNTNPYKIIEAATLEKQGLQNMLGNLDGYDYVASNYQSIDLANDMMLASVGGNQGESLINAIVDSVNRLPTTEAKAQFVKSLQSSDLIDNLFGVEGSEDVTLDSIISDKFIDANTQLYGDPLVVDLDGDGQLETRDATGDILFDHSGNGQATGTGWINAEDGLLVRDIDNSGTIDSGRELLGDNTIKSDGTKAVDGFDALRDLDSSGDGIFDANDSAFSEVKVWQDVDQDGVTDEGELLSLAEAGIESIDLNANSVNQNVEGGILRKTSTATTTDGTTTAVGAMDFAENKFYSRFADELEISPELEGSINVAGQGALRSLHEASSLSSELNTLLQDLYSGNTPVTDSAVHEVLLEWAKSAENFTTSLELLDSYTLEDGTQINLDVSDRVKTIIEKTAVLEAVNGERLLEYQITNSGGKYSVNIRTGVETSDFRIGGADVSKGSEVSLNDWDFHRLADSGRTTVINEGYASLFSSVKESIQVSYTDNEIKPFLLENISFELDDAGEVALNFDSINEAIADKIKSTLSDGINFFNKLVDYRDNTILTDNWNSQGLLENDIPAALSEVLDANVVLNNAEKMNFLVDGRLYTIDSLVGADSSDFILGTDFYDSISGGDGNDYVESGAGDDYIDGGNGNDIIYGGKGNDTLQGGYGNDKLYGGEGDDTIHTGSWLDLTSNYVEGGQGNDTIISNWGARNNTYKYNLGDGFDVIKNQGIHFDHNYRDHRVLFGEGISQENVDFQKQGNHLVIIVNGDESQGMRLDNFYLNEARYRSPVNRFEFDDGSIINASDLNFDIVGTSEDDILSGSDWSESLIGNEGNDTLKAGKGNDTLQGGQGNDKLYGDDNNDTLEGGLGDDYLDGGPHNDVLIGGEGNDTLQGGYGNDKLYGGEGDDTIHTGNWLDQKSNYVEGGQGNDTIISNWGASGNTYKYNLGDDFDVIKRQSTSSVYAHRNHKVLFGEGISFEDLSFAKQGNHLVVTIGGDDSQGIRIENFYHSSSSYYSPVNRFEFADGTVLGMSDIKIGTDQSDTLIGNDNNNFIYGIDGDDIISSGEGSDIISGGAGNDSISVSGTGNTIKYNLGDGFDNIKSLGKNLGYSDKVVFGEGITQEDLSYNQDGNDLIINVKGDETQGFRLVNFGVEQGSNIGSFEFADGTLASPRDILDQMNKPEPTHIGTDLSEKIVGTNDVVDVVYAGAGDDTVYLGSGDDIADAGDGNDIVKALNGGDNTIDGGSGNDRMETGAGLDKLSGGLGDDIIKAGAGDDVITGSLGNDDISGELGNNIINYNLGDGLDTIRAAKLDVTKQTDKIVFGENISQDDVQYLQRNEDLFVQVGADSEQGLLVKKFYAKSGYQTKVSGFEFADGSFKAIEDIQPVTLGTDLAEKIVGTNDVVDVVHAGAGDDTVYLGSGNDIADAGDGNDIVKALNGGDNTIDGGTGNDRIETGACADRLSGGLGDDIIKAGAGDDVITGGLGNDDISGELGNNVINYNLGDGLDTIRAAKLDVTDQTDKIVFGENISQDDVQYLQRNKDLFVQVGADSEQGLLVKKFYAKSGYQTKVSGFEFADGSFKAIGDIQPVTLGTDLGEKIVGTNDVVDIVHAGAGDDTVYLGSSDDIADAGDGNDIVKALNGGDNTIDGGTGNDRIETGAGLDTYNYSTGDGNDTINLAGDSSTDTLKLNDISKDDILFSRSDNDLLIDFSDQLSSLIVDDYFESQYNNDSLIIDTNDEFQMLLGANANKMAEILAANTSSNEDIDGGSVDGSNQVTTQVDASQLADLWVPKEKINI
ncbi:calcium-binding protein [Francisella sp. SYW-9]|uniref:calcium-binding protein n=1 Tax=Francisella sp. SYW-9 TaxID=2610888 RepID=UPI00123D9333|nr:calcium-binding protein [Francisella sp. SYW-9]